LPGRPTTKPDVAEPPEGLFTRCTGTLVDERVLLTAGHCVAWIKDVSFPPPIRFFVTFSPNARDRLGWRRVARHAICH
jgi:V8-like Glu-specific endopeptidase